MKAAVTLVAGALVLGTALAGCGGSSEPSDTTTVTAPAETVTVTAQPQLGSDLAEVCAAVAELGRTPAPAYADVDPLFAALTEVEPSTRTRIFAVIAGVAYAQAADFGPEEFLALDRVKVDAYESLDDAGFC